MTGKLLEGKRALITGAGSGIGRAAAQLFAAEGAAAGVIDIVEQAAEETAARIAAAGGKAVACRADVANEEDVRRCVETVAGELGGLDILVNNAGIPGGPPTTLDQMSLERWDRNLAVNLRAHLLFCQAAFPWLRRQGGAIVNNASSAAVAGFPYTADYATAKAGVVMLTRQLAAEWGVHGIRANSVAPGLIDTGFGRARGEPQQPPDPEERARRVRHIPLGRLGEAEDVARVMLFLASDLARYVTGENILVDGGLLQMFYPAVLDRRPG
ncbi:MAG: SDR family oxidoreductase [Chloroflexota bacterium]|nr:SDR family oxidoreductase [Chloroflexota bacterium]